ncbi:hypothetical protein BC829DRAFT_379705, partial [Chytridium lagenaria]
MVVEGSIQTQQILSRTTDKAPNHQEAVLDRHEVLLLEQQKKMLQQLQDIESKIQTARLAREALLREKSEKAHESKVEEVTRRRESLEKDKMEEVMWEIGREEMGEVGVLERKEKALEEKRQRARRSLDDVSAGKARAEMREAIRSSVVTLEEQEHELKEDIARDRKDSRIDLVRQSQPHLQNFQEPSVVSEI